MTSFPALASLPAAPKRIILHWSASSGTASEFDRQHYHFLVERDGKIVQGVPVEQNMRKLGAGMEYAAHTKGFNSFSVGVALCGMAGAVPKGPYGKFPLTKVQVESACEFVARLTEAWGLPVNQDTVFTHAEAWTLHGVMQAGKWDITVLPYDLSIKPEEVGPLLRETVRGYR